MPNDLKYKNEILLTSQVTKCFKTYDVVNVGIKALIFAQEKKDDEGHVEMMGPLVISIEQLFKECNHLWETER